MLDVAEFFNYWGVFPGDPMINSAAGGIYPPFNSYPGNLPGSMRIKLVRSTGGKPYEVNVIKYNFRAVELALNNLMDANFKEYASVPASKFLGANGTDILTQDRTTNQPRLDLTNVSNNRVNRIDENGRYPMPNSNFATPSKGRILSPDGTIWIQALKDLGYMGFAVSSTFAVYASVDGWATSAPSVPAASQGFAIDFIEGKSLWYIYRDNDVVAVIDGNNQTGNFVNTPPGDDAVLPAEEAKMLFNQDDDRIEFYCKTTSDASLKGTGYINSTGFHDGEA